MGTSQPSTPRAALHLVLDGMRRRGATAAQAPGGSPKRRVAVERSGVAVDPKRLQAFLKVTGGDAIPALVSDGAPLPPTVSSLWETALALELLGAAGIGMPRGGLIHLESESIPIRPMHPSDRFRSRVEMDRVEAHPRGRRLVLKSRCWNAAGQLCGENTVGLLARDAVMASRDMSVERPAGTTASLASTAAWRTVREWSIPGNLGRRYARVSGDFNPIHLWPWSARLMGFRSPVLHGFCIEGIIAHTLVAEVLGGDPGALRRLEIAFRSPLFLPARVRLLVAESDSCGRAFHLLDATNPQSRPYAEGRFVGSL